MFRKYIYKCLCGPEDIPPCEPTETEEFLFLQRTIDLMFEHTQRELELGFLRSDDAVTNYIDTTLSTTTPYTRLISEGLLSQKVDTDFMQKIEVIFVTYERVFEYLLAKLKIGELKVDNIHQLLSMARSQSFMQLRGAVELATSLSIVDGKTNSALLVELSHSDRPESRQFICDVVQTIYESGNKQSAQTIIRSLIEDYELSAKLTAAQASFQLKLDPYLIELALSDEEELREIAAIYLYERWNQARLDGNLQDAYSPIYQLRNMINLTKPRRSVRALSALLTLSLNMGKHVIDDKDSLIPLFQMLQEIVRSVPGFRPKSDLNNPLSIIMDRTAKFVIDLTVPIIANLISDNTQLDVIFDNPQARRELVDVGSLITLDSLVGYELQMKKLVLSRFRIVADSARSILTHFVYIEPNKTLPMLQEIVDSDDINIQYRLNVLHSIIYGLVTSTLSL